MPAATMARVQPALPARSAFVRLSVRRLVADAQRLRHVVLTRVAERAQRRLNVCCRELLASGRLRRLAKAAVELNARRPATRAVNASGTFTRCQFACMFRASDAQSRD